MNKNRKNFREMWDNIKHTNIHIMRITNVEEREKRTTNV